MMLGCLVSDVGCWARGLGNREWGIGNRLPDPDSRFPGVRLAPRFAILALILVTASCEREERRFSEVPPSTTPNAMVTASTLQPGPTIVAGNIESPYDDKAWGVSAGKQLFGAMNCSGCHSNGGGGMGPPLMDDDWIYGSQPQQIFASIAEGRPNGMPAWKYTLSNQQIWEIVAYVRSLSSLNPKGARSGRDDHMSVKPAEQQTPKGHPRMTESPRGAKTP